MRLRLIEWEIRPVVVADDGKQLLRQDMGAVTVAGGGLAQFEEDFGVFLEGENSKLAGVVPDA